MSAYEITYTTTVDVEDFEFWSGARSRMDGATDEQREQVFERVAEFCELSGEVRDVDINDLVWFECDDIFSPRTRKRKRKTHRPRERRAVPASDERRWSHCSI